MKRITVIGSSNIDLVAGVKQIPSVGSTVTGTSFRQEVGGKGANTAVACAKLQNDCVVQFVSAVGDDVYADAILHSLDAAGVERSRVVRAAATPTGMAIILVDDEGRNIIACIPGANHELSPQQVDELTPLLRQSDLVLLQNELHPRTTRHALQLCRRIGVETLFNFAPTDFGANPPDFGPPTWLIVNENEAHSLCDLSANTVDEARQCAAELRRTWNCKGVVITLGSKGALYHDGDQTQHVAARAVKAIDTVAAGDTFCGAFAVHLAEGHTAAAAMRFAVDAASLSVTRRGAQASIPTHAEVLALAPAPSQL